MQDTAAHAYDNYKGLTGRKRQRLDFKVLFLPAFFFFLFVHLERIIWLLLLFVLPTRLSEI